LLDQFTDNLNQLIASAPPPAETAPPPAAPVEGVRKIESEEVAPLDLLGTAGVPIVKRLIPVVIGLIAVAVVVGVIIF
jgi:hypothetical protein